ncbi:hypothetical protein NQ318_011118 [Aromia moschata]|uniref:Uncharacterized protein n=1 Tax=Aromia moschata TaxID=1265417 RepID=A0AAV8YSQ8_9CUCU|nr:hypothetical protein NQ318_011118 [Aromia moschata]
MSIELETGEGEDVRPSNIGRVSDDDQIHQEHRYDTENGITAEEHGEQRPVGNNLGTIAQGYYRYTSPEGVPVGVDYTADENGYHPVGSHLPTPPPIPEAILRSIAFIQARQQSSPSSYNRY